MKIDKMHANFPQENFEVPGQLKQQEQPLTPAVQEDQIQPFSESPEGPTGTIQQGLHSENADTSPSDYADDYNTGEAALWGLGAVTGSAIFPLLGIDSWLAEDVGNFVDHTFDSVGGVFDTLGQDIGGVPGDVISWFGNAVADTPEAFSDAVIWTENAIYDVADASAGGIEVGAEAVGDGAEAVIDGATDIVDGAGDVVGDAIDTVTDW